MNDIRIKRTGIVFVLSSPSGAGKTTVSKQLVKELDNLTNVTSVTTRPKRSKETDGVDYIFTSREQFNLWIASNRFLEYVTIFDHFYGTLRDTVKQNCCQNYDQLLTLNWLGAHSIKKAMPDNVVTIFLVPPSKKVLLERLKHRHPSDASTVDLRLSHYDIDIQHWQHYDYLVVNDDLRCCVQDIVNIIKAERMSCKRMICLSTFT